MGGSEGLAADDASSLGLAVGRSDPELVAVAEALGDALPSSSSRGVESGVAVGCGGGIVPAGGGGGGTGGGVGVIRGVGDGVGVGAGVGGVETVTLGPARGAGCSSGSAVLALKVTDHVPAGRVEEPCHVPSLPLPLIFVIGTVVLPTCAQTDCAGRWGLSVER